MALEVKKGRKVPEVKMAVASQELRVARLSPVVVVFEANSSQARGIAIYDKCYCKQKRAILDVIMWMAKCKRHYCRKKKLANE